VQDELGRVLLLRGINVSGATKTPAVPNVTTFTRDLNVFFDHRNVSFVGR